MDQAELIFVVRNSSKSIKEIRGDEDSQEIH